MRLQSRFHDLWHLSATLLLASGGPPKVVVERLGQASIREMLDGYSHFSTDIHLRTAAQT